jgi:hypothetical protein
MTNHRLSSLSDKVKRIENCGLFVDLIKTSKGTIRVGSMPDISKYLEHYGFREETVIVPDWEGSMCGDNRTGEEFVLWRAQVKTDIGKNYVGSPANLEQMRGNLDETFSYFFDAERIGIVRKTWLDNWFIKKPATSLYTDGSLDILFDGGNILVRDQGTSVYNRKELPQGTSPDAAVEEILATVQKDSASREDLEITAIGTGNGFTGTVSSFVVRFSDTVIWIDPCGYPAWSLAQHGIHWDDITHILITHNHEDHIQGFSACLKRAEYTEKPIQLITGRAILEVLRRQFKPLCPQFDRMIHFSPISPRNPLQLGSLQLHCRWNHHFLPYGTLGLKFSAGGKVFGFSGDTKLDERINRILMKKPLLPEWFASCDLLFHEVDFDSPLSVHTHWKQVERLAKIIPATILCYHAAILENGPLPQVRQGMTYRLE